jgi:hypothetical protein
MQVGLCADCRHARIIENRRGSRFWMCKRSTTDTRFPRYPRLPVLECSGYERGTPESTGGRKDNDAGSGNVP